MSLRLWCAISGHGFGHFSQVAPIVNHLAGELGGLRCCIAGNLPRTLLARGIVPPFEVSPGARDVCLIQRGPMAVDLEATRTALLDFHRTWEQRLEVEREAMARWQPDLVLANVPYLPMVSAHSLGIPVIAVASLSWDRVVAAYLPDPDPELAAILDAMREAYALAGQAMLLEPVIDAMPFPRASLIPPMVTPGESRRAGLRRHLGLSPEDGRPVVLISMGGVPGQDQPLDELARQREILWLSDEAPRSEGNIVAISTLAGWDFPALSASVDAIVSKPGYGTVVKAVADGVPILAVPRGTFPDEAPVLAWLSRHGRGVTMDIDAFRSGHWTPFLEKLWQQPLKPKPRLDGAAVACRLIRERMGIS
ncbi:MAG: hypothetical protein HQL59_06995 [Magnetococcales bacterium]|nr:hypothetical protein [Magnetococcales bacterium]